MNMDNSISAFYWKVLKRSIASFISEDMPTQAAALSYYMVFSLPPMLLVILWTVAKFYREIAVREAIIAWIGELVGGEVAQQVMANLEKLSVREPTWWGTLLGLAMLLFFATTFISALRTALNRIIKVEPVDSGGLGLWKFFRLRVIGFTILLGISFVLIVYMLADTLITAAGNYLEPWLGEVALYLMGLDAILLDLAFKTVMYAMFFRYLPVVNLQWRDIWVGALLTAILMVTGKYLIAMFVGNSEVSDLYDAAGSILVMMLWVYYTAAIFLFGATFTFTRVKMLGNEFAAADQSARLP